MTRSSRLIVVVALLLSAVVVGCSGGGTTECDKGGADCAGGGKQSKADLAPVSLASLGVQAGTLGRCDPIAAECLLPWPNDHFTVADESTPTGRRLNLSKASMPANAKGVHVDVTDQNRADGWSPGSAIMVQIPGLDVARSNLPSLTNAAASLSGASPLTVLDAETGYRVPVWAEIDSNLDPGQEPVLLIHPAENFADGHRIVIGLRGLKDSSGKQIAPTKAFAAYRDGQRTTSAAFETRRSAMNSVFRVLGQAGVARRDLQVAWDFTIASTKSLTGRMLTIRDDAFDQLGKAVPTYRISKVTEQPDEGRRRRIEGTFDLPNYLTKGGATGGTFVLDKTGMPTRQPGTFTADFRCDLPETTSTEPARMALYGHGLLGDLGEMSGSLTRRMAADHNIVYCATNWYGMAEEDIPTAVAALNDLSAFPAMADRIQQGFLAFLYLGRLMTHTEGFVADPAFQVDGHPAIDRTELYFDGNSQGAILGGGLAAVAQDFTRVVLAEAGMNYSLLLDRSVDFDEYLNGVMKPAYPTRFDRMIGIAAAQLLWDRGETDGYANHITRSPLANTPVHQVLLLGAVGDHQVTEYSLRVEAATLKIDAHEPIAGPGRVHEKDPGWLLDTLRYPAEGSAYFLWDTGSPRSPLGNTPPRPGHDPHDDTPNIPQVRDLKDAFWHRIGQLKDVCDGGACAAPIPPENAD